MLRCLLLTDGVDKVDDWTGSAVIWAVVGCLLVTPIGERLTADA